FRDLQKVRGEVEAPPACNGVRWQRSWTDAVAVPASSIPESLRAADGRAGVLHLLPILAACVPKVLRPFHSGDKPAHVPIDVPARDSGRARLVLRSHRPVPPGSGPGPVRCPTRTRLAGVSPESPGPPALETKPVPPRRKEIS